MASKYCSKCGREVVAGKRFCGGCGNAVPGEAAPQVETAAAGLVCGQCGTALVPGKKFCKQCGHAVSEVAAAAEFASLPEPPAVDDEPAPLPELPAVVEVHAAELPEVVAPVEADSTPVAEPEIVPPAEVVSEPLPASASEPVKVSAPPPAVSSEAVPEPETMPAEPDVAPVVQSKAELGLAIGVAAIVLMVAGGGWAWYAHMHAHRSASSESGQAAQSQSATGQLPNDEQLTDTTGEQLSKPPAGTSRSASAGAATAPINSPQKVDSPQRVEAGKSEGIARGATPDFHPKQAIPPVLTMPLAAQAHSGMRHYEGPPVAHGGSVVFENLPKARLKFTFDHSAWQLTIKQNPDGTKKVTLISLALGYQSRCDLGWEIIE